MGIAQTRILTDIHLKISSNKKGIVYAWYEKSSLRITWALKRQEKQDFETSIKETPKKLLKKFMKY